MKELMQLLNDAASGKNPARALNIPTADVAAALANANIDFSFVKFWLAGYYQTLRTLKAQFGGLTNEAQRDLNNVKAFLKQFDGDIDKWAEIRVAQADALKKGQKTDGVCQHITPRKTCGFVDKDDHTYSCEKLCKSGECPFGRSQA